jgi:dipeptidyl aminopeptidase/acylaminoacyl peptidase
MSTTQEFPHDEFRAINVLTHTSRVLADGDIRQVMISPNRRYAALIVDAGWNPLPLSHRIAAYEPHTTDSRHTRLAFVRLDTVAPTRFINAVRDPDIPTLFIRHAWSPDGNTFAVVARGDSTAPYPAMAFLVSARNDDVQQVTDRTFAVSRIRWIGSGRAVALGVRTIFASPDADTTREFWRTIGSRDASDTLAKPPRPDSVLPDWVHKLHQPSVDATIAAIDSSHELIVYTSDGRTGSFLWVGDGRTAVVRQRLALNEQLAHIADARRLLIHYIGADGDSLTGVLVLPIGYSPAKRYPLITWVYAGWTPTDTLDEELNKQDISGLNLALIPAHGYALLIPSMPLKWRGMGSDPMLDLPKGVMSAVDEVVRMGVADPGRLGLMGHSYGGYSTYGLIAYTKRFRGAIALAGLSDLPSFYGSFDPRTRYTSLGYEDEWPVAWSESAFGGMGVSPWENLWRYIRNSPYYYAERVETPLMIIQGDVDAVSMEQGEEFFTALSRMNKPVKFVRYWGEPHVIERSPANVRDMWEKIFDWFDVQLKPDAQRTAVR